MKKNHTILVVDNSKKHRDVLKHFIKRVHPRVRLVEYDPLKSGVLDPDTNWSKYNLLIIDNNLGDEDGLAWVKSSRDQPHFPPVIFLSSMTEPGSAAATQLVIQAIKLGAENFLFKKGIQVRQLNASILSALKQSGYDPDEIEHVDEKTAKESGRRVTARKTPGSGTREMELLMHDTASEIELAMAMLYGHAEWPFTLQDIFTGKAVIGDYKIISYLGKGVNATTFRARPLDRDEDVILRMVSQSLDRNSDSFRQCMSDIKKVSQWNHPNLVHWLDYDFIDGRLIVIQEYIAGPKLSKLLDRRGVTEEQAVHYIMGMLSGLSHLHANQLVVKDLSTNNLMFRDSDTVVLTNMGIVRRVHAMNQITQEQILKIEPIYTTPEKIQGRQTDSRSDLYIAGVILYEMLAGHPPFHRGSIQDILYAHVTLSTPLLPDKKHPLNRVIRGLLEKTPSKRIQTAQEAMAMLESIYGKVG